MHFNSNFDKKYWKFYVNNFLNNLSVKNWISIEIIKIYFDDYSLKKKNKKTKKKRMKKKKNWILRK